MEPRTTRHMYTAESGTAKQGMVPGYSYGSILGSSYVEGVAHGSMTDPYLSPVGPVEVWGSSGHVILASAAQDQSAWLNEAFLLRLRDLLSKVVTQNSEYVGLPDVLVMPQLPTKRTTLRVVHMGPAEFRFFED